MRRIIQVVDYDPSWPVTFASLRANLWEAVQGIAVSVEHVGSTSVPGLAAKPIIDIDVVVATPADMPDVIARLATLGYVHRGNLGVEGREAFETPLGLAAHHLYACVQGGVALKNHLTVRDALRGNAAAAAKYGALKKQLAVQFPEDIEGYIEGKTAFLLEVLRNASFPESVLQAIGDVNRRK